MRSAVVFLLTLFAASPAFSRPASEGMNLVGVSVSSPTGWVTVIWPPQDAELPFVRRSFTLGNAAPGSTLTINGRMVELNADGAFFTMVDFSTGAFHLDYNAVWLGQFASTRVAVSVAGPYGLPDAEGDELVGVAPSLDMELRAGDLVTILCRGPSGFEGKFEIRGLNRALPLAERGGEVPGVYEGHYYVQPEDRGRDMVLSCSLKRGFWDRLHADAPGKLSIVGDGQTRVAVTSGKANVVKSETGGYSLFLPDGVRLEIAGKRDGMARVILSEHEEGWIAEGSVSYLPEGTPPPRGEVGLWTNIVPAETLTSVKIRCPEKLPFEVRHALDPLSFTVRFFGASHHFDRVRYDGADPVVKEIAWRQESSRVATVEIETKIAWGWGYDAYYDENGFFVLDIRRPPDLTRAKSVLAGRKVVVDPGHGPWASAIGPLGTTERDVNLGIGAALQALLSAEGADVYMTRTSTDGPSLVDRTFLAWERGGDLFISIHNNAFPVTVDPWEKPRGYMTFFYQALSRPLVDRVHAAYVKNRTELADEFVQWGNLYVCRMTQMPSILTESAYMIFPEHEKRLRDPAYQKEVAKTILEGVKTFYEDYRKLQLASPAEQNAARKQL